MSPPATPDLETFRTEAKRTLEYINGKIAFYEKRGGPLVRMAIDNGQSLFTYELKKKSDRPTKFAEVFKDKDGKAQLPPNYSKVAAGKILVAGDEVDCTAGRPK